jgi:hypothetical protein
MVCSGKPFNLGEKWIDAIIAPRTPHAILGPFFETDPRDLIGIRVPFFEKIFLQKVSRPDYTGLADEFIAVTEPLLMIE